MLNTCNVLNRTNVVKCYTTILETLDIVNKQLFIRLLGLHYLIIQNNKLINKFTYHCDI